MIKTLLICLLLFSSWTVFGQTKTIKTNMAERLISYEYKVLKKDPGIKEGSFKAFFKGNLYLSGSYHQNKKQGDWTLRNIGNAISYDGHFNAGLPSGEWKYYYKKKLYSIVHYNNNGEFNGTVFAFDEKGDTIAFQHFIDGKHEGITRFYYPNGQLKQRTAYKNDLRTSRESYFDNGNINSKLIYKNGQPYNVEVSRDSKGDSLKTGKFKDGNGYLIQYYPGTTIPISNGYYKNSFRNGQFAFYYKDGSPACLGNYTNGFAVGIWKIYGHDNIKPHNELVNETTLDTEDFPSRINVDILAQFVGGINGLMAYLGKEIRYPADAKKNKQEGTVIISFIIDNNGEVEKPQITQQVSPSLDQAAKNIISNLPVWSPGMKDYIPVKVNFNIPVRFAL